MLCSIYYSSNDLSNRRYSTLQASKYCISILPLFSTDDRNRDTSDAKPHLQTSQRFNVLALVEKPPPQMREFIAVCNGAVTYYGSKLGTEYSTMDDHTNEIRFWKTNP